MERPLTRFGVKLPLSSVTLDEQRAITSELTISPLPSDYDFRTVKYKIFSLSKNSIYVPRFYQPSRRTLTLPSFESISVEFVGSLKESTCQVTASDRVISELRTKTGCVLSLPTGYGKTTVALYVLAKMATKTLIIVHKEFLMNQWIEKIKQFLPSARIGKIQGDVVDVTDRDVVVGMLQSLSGRAYPDATFSSFGLTIIDETHHICTRTFSRIFGRFNTAYVLGLSATLERKDGLTHVIHYFLGDVGFFTERKNQKNVSVKTLKLTHHEPFPVNTCDKANMSEAITMLTTMGRRNDLILNTVNEIEAGRKMLILSDRRDHCVWLQHTLQQRGLDTGLYMGGMKADQLKESETKAIIVGTYSLAHEGLDIPALDCIFLATPKSNIIQAVGRILRETQGKQNEPLVIDLVDLWGPFNNQYKKRKAYYTATGFTLLDAPSRAEVHPVFQME